MLTISILFTSFAFAQLNYQVGGFSTFSSTYTDLGTTGTAITMTNNDSGHSAPKPIGFTFNFNGASYDSFVMYVDGFLKLGSVLASSDTNMNFTAYNQPPIGGPFNSSSPQDTSLIFPLGNDLWGAAYNSITPSFRVSTTGTVGTRICTIQWKNLSDKIVTLPVQGSTTTVLEQYDTINFQVKLYEGTNAIEFVYGTWAISSNTSQARFGACGIKGNNNGSTNAQIITVTKGSAVSWSGAAANAQTTGTPLGNYTVNALNFGNNNVTARPAPDPGRVYHFNPVVYNDAAVQEIRAMGKVAIPAYVADSIKVKIANSGINAISSLVVTLTISGANTFTTTKTITGLASGTYVYVSFPPYTPTNTGASLITVSVPVDDNTTNNTNTYSLSVSGRTLGYTDTTRTFSGSNGSISQIYACKYRVNGSRLVSSVKFFIPSNSTATGVIVNGVVIDSTNTIVGTSSTYTLLSTDMGTYVTLNILSPPTIVNTYFYVGILVGSNTFTAGSFLNIYQNEGDGTATNPPRPEVSYTFPSTAGVSPTQQYNGRQMIECNVDPLPAIDIGVSNCSPKSNVTVPSGASIPLRAYVKNFGTGARASGLQVRYSVNGGSVVGPITTSVALPNTNDTTSVLFTGANSLLFATTGTYTVKIFTNLSGDAISGNDTLTVTYNVVAAINTFPYRLANGILTTWTPVNNTAPLWLQGTATQANGVSSTVVMYANNHATNMAGADAKVVSPIFSFVGLANPILHFTVAHAPSTTTNTDDTLQVLVSTDGGTTYTPVYTKSSQLSSPTLGTIAAQSTASASYVPASATDWRHEAVNLSAYAGNPFVIIAFRDYSANGNSVYIGNVVISNPTSIVTQAVTSASTFTNGNFSIFFPSAIGATTGIISISKYPGSAFSSASPVYATNTSATTNNSSVFTPTNISIDNWWTVCYSGIGTGNLPSTAQYYAQINYSTVTGVSAADYLYIMKRSENNGSWVAISTVKGGSVLLSSLLTGFSDFAIGSQPAYNPLPVKWLSISAKKTASDVMIEWSTAQEINNNHFEVERSENGIDFIMIGEIKGSTNSNANSPYSFLDKDILSQAKTVYYRIKQVDNDGMASVSKMVSVTINGVVEAVVAYPNPFTRDMELRINPDQSSEAKISVTDLSGREVLNKTVRTEENSSVLKMGELNKLNAGFYLMHVQLKGEVYNIKIHKTE